MPSLWQDLDLKDPWREDNTGLGLEHRSRIRTIFLLNFHVKSLRTFLGFVSELGRMTIHFHGAG